MNILSIILFLIIYCNSIFYQIFGINTENYIAVTCSNENNCENSGNIEINDVKTTENTDYVIEYNDNNEWELNVDTVYTNQSINSTTKLSTTTLPSIFQTSTTTKISINNINESIITNLTSKSYIIVKNNAKICTCDLTILQCDINCCCDHDCTEFHLAIFSHCTDHQTKKYDSRYCYKKNFIHRNNTKFILKQLTDNLFCIAYDNLPPKYSKSNAIKIDNRKEFDEIMKKNIIKKFTWTQNKIFIPLNFNSSITYRDGDVIWKIESQSIKPIEFPMSGFTSHCTFQKNLQYLKDFNTNCLQIKLSNENNNLFIETFNNFTVISSPIFINTTYILSSLNQTCPKNICITIETKYCINSSFSSCNMTKPLEASCINGTCKNIVKGIRYIIIHNGTMGIKQIQLYIELANVSKSFYQNFNVHYQWADINEHNIHHRSGNPGYLIGKPIIIGTLKPNTTDDISIGNNNTNNDTKYFFTVPLATNNGNCHKDNRYIIKLGEDIKLKCHIKLMTNNFSHNSCIELNNEILSIFFQQSFINITDIEQYKIYVSKLGNITNNNNISNWNQILLNKVPNRILKSEKTHEKIHCYGMTTSLGIDILYSLLPKPDNIDNYKIVGVGLTLIEEEIITWVKCLSANCTDILDVDLITYVKFYDISTPETYYYAGGPNLDISLPYDFFYPFLSGVSAHYQSNLFILTFAIITVIIFN